MLLLLGCLATCIKGNELADAATGKSNIDSNIGLELSMAVALGSRGHSTGAHYRSIEKTASTKIKYLHSSRHTEVTITSLRLGKCCLNAYLHQTSIRIASVTTAINWKLSVISSLNVATVLHAQLYLHSVKNSTLHLQWPQFSLILGFIVL